ncbi:MAG: hypothetical protein RIC54_24935 [Thalassobaculum sp.]|uniref:hypothetical protein n=1 Tax=Thalassobaculum sp. TaxID=2022740 RepID=UPI0032F028FF
MIRQYYPPRHRIGAFGRPVGTIAAGTIFRVTDGSRGIERYVDTVMVEAWLPRDYAIACIGPGDHRTHVTVRIRGGHLAVVRSLRSGRRYRHADWLLHTVTERLTEKGKHRRCRRARSGSDKRTDWRRPCPPSLSSRSGSSPVSSTPT